MSTSYLETDGDVIACAANVDSVAPDRVDVVGRAIASTLDDSEVVLYKATVSLYSAAYKVSEALRREDGTGDRLR